MARVKRSVHGRKHHRAVLEQAKGYYGNKSRSYRAANEQLMHSMQYAFRDRRARKGDFRKLWIQRINAGARQHGMSYSRLINGLHLAGVEVDRKVLADLAVSDSEAFGALVATARGRAVQRARRRGRFLTQRLAFSHRRVRRLRGLLQKRSARWAERAFVAEGAELIRCALDAGVPIESLYVSPDGADDRAVQDVCRRAEAAGVRVFPLGAGVLERVADTVTPQPVLAVLPMLDEPPAGTEPWSARDGALVVVLVDVRDPGNAGTVLRRRTPRGRRSSSTPATRSTPTTPRRCAPRPGRSSTCPWPCGRIRPAWRLSWPPAASAPSPRWCAMARTTPDSIGPRRQPSSWVTSPRGCPPSWSVPSRAPWASPWRGRRNRSTSAWPARWSASRPSASAGAAVPRRVASRAAERRNLVL